MPSESAWEAVIIVGIHALMGAQKLLTGNRYQIIFQAFA